MECQVRGRASRSLSEPSKAIRAAIDAAHLIGSRGEDAQVLVQDENMQFRTEWTFGQDVYPPKD